MKANSCEGVSGMSLSRASPAERSQLGAGERGSEEERSLKAPLLHCRFSRLKQSSGVCVCVCTHMCVGKNKLDISEVLITHSVQLFKATPKGLFTF